MIDDKRIDDRELEALFEGARAAPALVPDGLMRQVLEDAEALQPSRPLGLFTRLFKALGGTPGMGGLITATCVGFWLGVAPPDGVPDLAGNVLGVPDVIVADASGDAFDDFGWNLEEGELDG
jgi:hypothetical protein